MESYKEEILRRVCYTELVYDRINKKLNKQFTKGEIERLMVDTIKETEEPGFQKRGKNIYVTNYRRNIRITVNSNNYRIITVDQPELKNNK